MPGSRRAETSYGAFLGRWYCPIDGDVPPSTGKLTPVVWQDSSDERNRTALATSHAVPILPKRVGASGEFEDLLLTLRHTGLHQPVHRVLRRDPSGKNRVTADSPRCEHHGQLVCQRVDTRLGHAVGEQRSTGGSGTERGSVHDGATSLILHDRQHGTAGQPHRAQIDVHDTLPTIDLQLQRVVVAFLGRDIVHQGIDPTHGRTRVFDETRTTLRIGDVRGDGVGVAALRGDLPDGLIGPVEHAIDDTDLGPFPSKRLGDSPSDTDMPAGRLTSANDNRLPSLHATRHWCPFCIVTLDAERRRQLAVDRRGDDRGPSLGATSGPSSVSVTGRNIGTVKVGSDFVEAHFQGHLHPQVARADSRRRS